LAKFITFNVTGFRFALNMQPVEHYLQGRGAPVSAFPIDQLTGSNTHLRPIF
jgi:hypothetical protein